MKHSITYSVKQKRWDLLLYGVLALLIITLFIVMYVFIYYSINHSLLHPPYLFLFILFVLMLVAGIYSTIKFLVITTNEIDSSKHELALKDVIIEHSNEIIILLDHIGKILSINPALTTILNFDKEELIQQPFRAVLYEKSFEDSVRLRDLLLSRFKDVFKGYEAEIVLPCKVQHYAEIKSIAFKLVPIFKDEQLQYILAIGRIMQSDYLTSN